MLTIADELERKLRLLAENSNQSVESTLIAIIDQKFAEMLATLPPREQAMAKLEAVGMLRKPAPNPNARSLTTEELLDLGRVPPGSPSSESLIREDRDAD